MNTVGFELDLTDPGWLAALAVAAPVLIFWFWRSLVDFERWQLVASLICRSLIALLLILAIAGLTLREPTRELFVVFGVDRSLSVGESSQSEAQSFVEQALATRRGQPARVFPFGGGPGAVVEPGTALATVDDRSSNLAAAIEAAAAAIPPNYV
ncbi:MAG: hypothetical protein EHM42_08490, partial [Planctomycetaceae bacterium]